MKEFLKEVCIYAKEILPSKIRFVEPRVEVGNHLEYEKKVRERKGEKILKFHLERNLHLFDADRYYIKKMMDSVRKDFQLLAELLVTNPLLKNVSVLAGITNFQDRTGKRYGFESKEIISNSILRILFDNRLNKPAVAYSTFSAPPIRHFQMTRERFLEEHLTREV